MRKIVVTWVAMAMLTLAVALPVKAGECNSAVEPVAAQSGVGQYGSAVAGSSAILGNALEQLPVLGETPETAEPRLSFQTRIAPISEGSISLLDSRQLYHASHYIGRRDNVDYRVLFWMLTDPGLSGPKSLTASDQQHREIELGEGATCALNDGRTLMMFDLGEMSRTVGDYILFEYDIEALFGRHELYTWVSTENVGALDSADAAQTSVPVVGAAALDMTDYCTVTNINNSSQDVANLLFAFMLLLVCAAAWLKMPSGAIPANRR